MPPTMFGPVDFWRGFFSSAALRGRAAGLVCVALEKYIGSSDDNGDIDVSEEATA
jgi:hypothetical protein